MHSSRMCNKEMQSLAHPNTSFSYYTRGNRNARSLSLRHLLENQIEGPSFEPLKWFDLYVITL
jgi:hypothetical protein